VNSSAANPKPKAPAFVTTRWTLVLNARGATPEAEQALGDLCAAYWQPVFSFIRRRGHDEPTARDLTQEFFARLLARNGLRTVERGRGRFRSFLLGAVKHFLSDLSDYAAAAKRGGQAIVLPLDQHSETLTGLQIADPQSLPSDIFFDREWAVTLVNRAVEILACEQATSGRAEEFAVLKPWLLGEIRSTQAEAARRLGWTENAVRVAVHRLRRRFRDLVRAEIAQTVEGGTSVQDELRYLLEVLSDEGSAA
jgi:RNA polymerase sigma-70 factor (ECF subfamily)